MTRYSRWPLATLALLALQAPCKGADVLDIDEDVLLVYGDKASVSIATGAPQSLRRAPAVATVITAADIAAMGAADLDDVLETVPGLHVSRSANSYAPLYVVRGIYSQQLPQVLMLQNGVPLTTLFVGNKGNLWGGYPVEHIARIEVIRGPGSALYGADAFSAVINIMTKGPADTVGTEFGLRAGAFETGSAWVQHAGAIGPVKAAAYLRIGATEGIKEVITADAQSARDRLTGTRVSLAPGPVNTGYQAIDAHLDLGLERWRLHAGYKLRDDVGTGAGLGSVLDPVGKMKSERVYADVSWTDASFAKDWGTGFLASYQYYAQLMPVYPQISPPGTRIGANVFVDGLVGAPETWERQLRLSAFASYTGFTGHSLRLGWGHDDLHLYRTREHRNFDYAPTGVPLPTGPVRLYEGDQSFLTPHRRSITYVYAQDEWMLAKDWSLTAGLRHDRYSDFGGTTNPRLALVWDASLDLTAKLLYGKAFRSPSFSEQYSLNNPVNRGNPQLSPERIRTVEAALDWQARRDTQVKLSLFRYAMTDIIRTVPNSPPVPGFTFFNTGGQRGHGMELEVAWDASRSLRLMGHYARQAAIDETTKKNPGYVPKHHLYARGDWRFSEPFALGMQVNWVAGRQRSAGDARPPIPDYTTLDLVIRTVQRRARWSYAASLRNVFNARVLEPSPAPGTSLPFDLPMAPRSLQFQATYSL